MSSIGIICDLQYSRHHLFESYFHAVHNVLEKPKLIQSVDDLQGVQLLFIGDTHYHIHNKIWKDEIFIKYCNDKKIKVVALDNEKILDSFFAHNIDNLKMLKKFQYLYHYANDVDDCYALGLKLNRTAPSIFFKETFENKLFKKNCIVFIGKTKCPKNSYKKRNELLSILRSKIEIDTYESTIEDWKEYVNLIGSYRFVLSPVGNGNFFPMRFYEALAVQSVPVHQVTETTLNLYDQEALFQDCIFFKSANDLLHKLHNFPSIYYSFNKIWMEDNLQLLLKNDNLI